MIKPLTKWHCDICDDDIVGVNKGYVIWKSDDSFKAYGFKIIHQQKCDQKDHNLSAALTDFLGEDGKTRLLCFLSYGAIAKTIHNTSNTKIIDMDEFVDFFRRVQTPYYEEARKKFSDPDVLEQLSDASESYPYTQGVLEKLANE